MTRKGWQVLALCVCLLALLSTRAVQAAGESMTFGFVQDAGDPLLITAVAYPDFNSTNVTISTAQFTFLLPEGTVTDPAVADAPSSGGLTNVTGTWLAQKVTPTVWGNVGQDAADLEGRDVYQVTLQNSPSPNAVAGTAIELFRFALPSDCASSTVEVLTNDSAIQQVMAPIFGNINNQMSVSVNGESAIDIYDGNNPASFALPCPLVDGELADYGDLPPGSQVAFRQNGARHRPPAVGDATVWLGQNPPDYEFNGITDENAVSDDAVGDDEDGFARYTSIVAGEPMTLFIEVNGTANSADLGLWIDWNANGFFTDTVDYNTFFDNVSTETRAALMQHTVTVPAEITGSNSHPRVRLRIYPASFASDGDHSNVLPYGAVEDGEIEDHLITFEPTSVALRGVNATCASRNCALQMSLLIASIGLIVVTVVLVRTHERWQLYLPEEIRKKYW